MARVRWGILGTARIARHWVAAARQSEKSELLAVGSRSLNKAKSFANEHGIPRAYGSYEGLLEDNEIDAVYVPLPNALHAEWIVQAIGCKKHVLSEKPLVYTASDADRILSLSQRLGVHVAEGFPNLYHPQYLALMQMCKSGSLGAIRFIDIIYSAPILQRGGIVADPALGGGALLALGCYGVSFAIGLLPQQPSIAFGSAGTTPSGVDEYSTAFLSFPKGEAVTIYSAISGPACQSAVIHADNGMILMTVPFRPDLDGNANGFTLIDKDRNQYEHKFEPCNPFKAEIEAFVNAVTGHECITPWPLKLSVLGAHTIESIRRASSGGTR